MRPRRAAALTTAAAAAFLMIAAGCTTDEASSAPTGAELIGTWEQSGAGFERGVSVTWVDQVVVIESADGQGFTGFKEYTPAGEATQTETLNGVIATNGDILITDEDGVFRGRLENGTILGQYAETGDDAAAINVELVRE